MNLKSWVEAEYGRGTALAKLIGVPPSFVSKMVNGTKPVPFEQCMPIERATNGEVTRRDLRPDDCHIHWPDLAQAQAEPAQAAIKTIAEEAQFAIRHQEQAAAPEINPMATAPQAEGARELSRHA